jgi:Cytochrome c554 and c-prime
VSCTPVPVVCSLLLLTPVACSGPPGQQRTGQPPAATNVRQVLSGAASATTPAAPLKKPPSGPFGLSLVSTSDGKPADIENFAVSPECGECHPRQWRELKGSLHSVAHRDSLYRRAAELARAEAGPAVYAYCSSCHTPQGVASKLVPATPEDKLPEAVKAGIICDSCHSVTALSGRKGPWREPGNASIVLTQDSERKYGPPVGDDEAAEHPVSSRPFFQQSAFCASCHTVIHPLNGVRLEHTYDEWKRSVYAKKGIQCQDCHMRTVAQARRVAATLKPITVQGRAARDGKRRPIARHAFVGGNANADLLGGGKAHAKLAAERLRSAARLEVNAPRRAVAGQTLRLEVTVTNIGAGHNLPTSLIELREMWVELEIRGADGQLLHRSGGLDGQGEIDPAAMRFGARAGDKHGKLTDKPWEVTHFLWKRLIPPRASAKDAFTVPVPAGTRGPLAIRARLLYRSAPPRVVRMLFGKQTIALRTVEMARTTQTVAIP